MDQLKALYMTMEAAQLFWEQLTKHLVNYWGFKLNPYDLCVANKVIKGQQCTIVWHVDDLKISHVNEAVVDEIIMHLNKEFGSWDPMMVSNEQIHDYLGMTLDYTTKDMLKVNMIAYIDGILEDTPQDIEGTAQTLAASYQFKVNKMDPTLLSGQDKELIHHITMQLAYLAQ